MLTGRKSPDRQGELNSATTTIATTTMTIVKRDIFSLTSANCNLYPFTITLLQDGISEGRKTERKRNKKNGRKVKRRKKYMKTVRSCYCTVCLPALTIYCAEFRKSYLRLEFLSFTSFGVMEIYSDK